MQVIWLSLRVKGPCLRQEVTAENNPDMTSTMLWQILYPGRNLTPFGGHAKVPIYLFLKKCPAQDVMPNLELETNQA